MRLRLQGAGSMVKGLGCRVFDLEFAAWGLGFEV
jgi:hypothetical protein